MEVTTYNGRTGELLAAISRLLGDNLTDIPVVSRCAKYNVCRVIYSAYRARVEDAKAEEIGRELQRDRTTIVHFLKCFRDWEDAPQYYRRELAAFDDLRKLLNINKI